MAEHHVISARKWIGTPYRHQSSVKGVGCDCLGLVRGVWRDTVGAEPMVMPTYTPDWDEYEGLEVLMSGADQHLIQKPIDVFQPGEILLFRMKKSAVAKHLGILAPSGSTPRIIHAISGRNVAETSLTPDWQKRIVGQYAFPERSSLWQR